MKLFKIMCAFEVRFPFRRTNCDEDKIPLRTNFFSLLLSMGRNNFPRHDTSAIPRYFESSDVSPFLLIGTIIPINQFCMPFPDLRIIFRIRLGFVLITHDSILLLMLSISKFFPGFRINVAVDNSFILLL